MAIVSTYLPMVVQTFRERQAKGSPPPRRPRRREEPRRRRRRKRPRTGRRSTATPVGLGRAILGVGALLLLVAALPFLAGVKNLLGLLIIGFGLWEAWKLNKRTDLSISGPYQVGAAPAAALPGS